MACAKSHFWSALVNAHRVIHAAHALQSYCADNCSVWFLCEVSAYNQSSSYQKQTPIKHWDLILFLTHKTFTAQLQLESHMMPQTPKWICCMPELFWLVLLNAVWGDRMVKLTSVTWISANILGFTLTVTCAHRFSYTFNGWRCSDNQSGLPKQSSAKVDGGNVGPKLESSLANPLYHPVLLA